LKVFIGETLGRALGVVGVFVDGEVGESGVVGVFVDGEVGESGVVGVFVDGEVGESGMNVPGAEPYA
jgi:hypothetical protein